MAITFSLNPVEAGSGMKAVLLLVSFVLLACVLAQGYEGNQKEVHGSDQETMEAIPGAFSRIKRNAESIRMKNKGREKKKVRNEKKRQRNKGKRKSKGRKKSRNLTYEKLKKNKNKKGKKDERQIIKSNKQKKRPIKWNNKKERKKKGGKKQVNKYKGDKMKSTKQANCGDANIMNDKIFRIKQMDNRMRQAKRAERFHKVIGNKCKKANAYTVAAKRFENAILRAGGKENCKTDPTANLTTLQKCEEGVCKICSSPLSAEWQAKYKECDSTAKAIKMELEAALTCDAITAANAKAKAKNTECAGPLANTTTVKTACANMNKECKDLKDEARGVEVDCKAPVELESANSTVDETQENRTSVVEASLDTFINGTGDLLNNLGLSTGEGSDGTISADAQAVVDNITRTDTITDNPTCTELISYSAALIDFSDAAEQQDTLSEEQTSAATDRLGTINNLVSTGAAGTALSACNTRQASQYYQAIFRWIIWRCYYFFFNWLRRNRCRRLERLCFRKGIREKCLEYCGFCEIPELSGGIWWWEPQFTYNWYPVNPCLDRTKCVFNCPQCPEETMPPPPVTTPAPETSTAKGRRAKFFKALLRKAKKIN